jgi:flagellar biosynthesis/type III secretory pathway protein FliH
VSVIKSGNLAGLSSVRPIASQAQAAVVALQRQDEERERLHRRIAGLESELRERDVAIDVLRKDVERAFEEGTAKGHAAGLADAEDKQNDRLGRLEASARKAQEGVAAGLVSLERLAALLARECVDKVLGNAQDRADLIGYIIAVQLAKIDKSMLLAVEVSREDFADDEALAALAQRLAPLTVVIEANGEMASGACAMRLRLGRLSVGIDQQWGALKELLTQMAEPEAAI